MRLATFQILTEDAKGIVTVDFLADENIGAQNGQLVFEFDGFLQGNNGLTFDPTTRTLTLNAVVATADTPIHLRAKDGGQGDEGLEIDAPDGTGGRFNVTVGINDLALNSDANTDALIVCQNVNTGNNAASRLGAFNDQNDGVEFAIFGSGSATTPRQAVMNAQGPATDFFLQLSGTDVLIVDRAQNVVVKTTANAASDTNGFLYVPLTSGNQSGVPAKLSGKYANSAPIRLQNNGGTFSLAAYINGAWRKVTLT